MAGLWVDLAAIAVLALGLWLFFRGLRSLSRWRTLSAIAVSKARSVAMGMAALSGIAERFGNLLTDPIFGEACTYFDVCVQERLGSGSAAYWSEIHRLSSGDTPLLLADDTGRVAVYPDGARLYIDYKVDQTVGGAFGIATADVAVVRFVEGLGRGGPMRVLARIVREREPLYVLGYAVSSEARNAVGASRPAPPGVDVVIRKTPDGLLVLADKAEKDFLSDMVQVSAWETIGGPLLSLASAALLALRWSQ